MDFIDLKHSTLRACIDQMTDPSSRNWSIFLGLDEAQLPQVSPVHMLVLKALASFCEDARNKQAKEKNTAKAEQWSLAIGTAISMFDIIVAQVKWPEMLIDMSNMYILSLPWFWSKDRKGWLLEESDPRSLVASTISKAREFVPYDALYLNSVAIVLSKR